MPFPVVSVVPVISMMWVQEFEEESDGLVSHALTSMFNSEDIAVHATKWDATFKGADILKDFGDGLSKESPSTRLVHWRFNASPLAGRELVYLIASKKIGNAVIHGYPSVSSSSRIP
jgi:hypothetical protein